MLQKGHPNKATFKKLQLFKLFLSCSIIMYPQPLRDEFGLDSDYMTSNELRLGQEEQL